VSQKNNHKQNKLKVINQDYS